MKFACILTLTALALSLAAVAPVRAASLSEASETGRATVVAEPDPTVPTEGSSELPEAPIDATEHASEPLENTLVSTEGSEPAQGPAVSAEDEAKANELLDRASKAFEVGQYDLALELMEESFKLSPKPNVIFNIGRVYEEAGRLEEALDQYANFIVQPGMDLELRKFAAGRLAVLREILKQTETEAGAVVAPIPSTEVEVDEPEPPAAPPIDEDVKEPVQPRMRPVRIAGYVLLGVGGATLITGGIVGGIAYAAAYKANNEVIIEDENELRNDVRSLARATDGLFIAGGIVAAAGIVSLVVSFTKKQPRQVAFVPNLTRTHVGLGIVRHF